MLEGQFGLISDLLAVLACNFISFGDEKALNYITKVLLHHSVGESEINFMLIVGCLQKALK